MANLLPTELLCFIGYKLDTTRDRIRFRAVSKTWRSALPFRRPPCLLLSISDHAIEFVIVGEETIYKFDFPQTHEPRVVGCTGKCLITMHLDKTIRLSDPLARLQFQQLPSNFNTTRYQNIPREISDSMFRNGLLEKIVLSSSPRDGDDRNLIAMAVNWDFTKLLIATPGDASWTTVNDYQNLEYINFYQDITFFDQRFYIISARGKLVVCNIGDGVVYPQLSFLLDCSIDNMPPRRKHYLVEVSGELLMVVRFLYQEFSDEDEHYYIETRHRTYSFKIYKIDFANMKFDEFKCLGDHSLFLGFSTSVSVQASDYFGLVRTNCIYFTNDLFPLDLIDDGFAGAASGTVNDIGVFDLEDNSISCHYQGIYTSLYYQSQFGSFLLKQ